MIDTRFEGLTVADFMGLVKSLEGGLMGYLGVSSPFANYQKIFDFRHFQQKI
jgi:hypothetical protein